MTRSSNARIVYIGLSHDRANRQKNRRIYNKNIQMEGHMEIAAISVLCVVMFGLGYLIAKAPEAK